MCWFYTDCADRPYRNSSRNFAPKLKTYKLRNHISTQDSAIKKPTIKRIRTLILLLAVSVEPLDLCNAQTTVFLDTFSNAPGTAIIGQTPDVGLGALQGNSGGTLTITANHTLNTVGAARTVYGAFTSALGPGQQLSLSFNVLNFGPIFPNSQGFAGVSLYTNYSSFSNNATGNEEAFIGEPNGANQWGLDQATTGALNSGNTNTPATATFTYVYNTGVWTFTTSGGVNMSGTGVSYQAFNALRIANGNGGDIELSNLSVVITTNLSTQVGGTWTALAHSPPVSVNNCLLLSDGTILGMDGDGKCAQLTPDSHGSYINGTWKQLSSMRFNRLFYASQLLTNGTVFVAGGEDGPGNSHGEVFDPLRNAWTWIYPDPMPGAGFSDCESKLLPNGNVLVPPVSEFGGVLIYNTASNSWQTAASAQNQDEACWVKLANDNILTIDSFSQNAEHYIPSLNKWVTDNSVSVPLYDSNGELGAGFLLPNGKVFYIGATTNTAIYTPGSTATSAGSWVAGPAMVFGSLNLGAVDAPAAMMPDGNILCDIGPVGGFNGPCYFYEYNYVENNFTQVTAPGGGTSFNSAPFVNSMLDLPDGSVLLVGGQNTQSLYIYTPNGAPLAAGQPAINSIAENTDGSYQMTGTNLNGISQGAAFGDDEQMDSNYPLIRMTNNVTGNVYYARTFNWNSTSVQTGNRIITTQFVLPQGLPGGTYSMVAVANGNASVSTNFAYSPPSVPTGLTAVSGSNGFVCLSWNPVSSATAYNVKRSSTVSGYYATLETVSGTAFTNSPLTNGLTYFYKVAAIGSGGPSSDSSSVSATPSGSTPIPGATPINLSSYFNRTGITADGSTFSSSLDAGAYSYSANLLTPALFWNNLVFTFGPANAPDVVACGGQTVTLPPGQFNTVQLLAIGVNGNQTAQNLIVTYTDNSTVTFTQSFSDWVNPQFYSGENTALMMCYRNQNNGTSQIQSALLLGGYIFTLDPTKTVKSIALPNNSNLVILAMQLATDSTPVSLSAYYNRAGIYTDGTTYTNPATGGLDSSSGGSHSYTGTLLGSWQLWTNTIFDFGTLNATNIISCSNQTVSLPSGNYARLRMLAASVNGNLTAQSLTVTYTDASTTTFTQSFSDWTMPQNYSGESKAVPISHRNASDGSTGLGSYYLYGYDFALNPAKTAQSIQLPSQPTGGIANNSSVMVAAMSLVPNWPPTFNLNPLTLPGATSGQSYSANIVTNASDLNGNPLMFAKVSGPAWLTVATSGALSGIPADTDANTNTFLISVTDNAGLSSTDTVYISVTGAPLFIANPFTMPPVTAGQNYSGTIATNAADPNNGYTPAFSLLSGPGWLSVSTNGALSGEPLSVNVGTNTFVVTVSDQGGLSNSATMLIPVTAAPPIQSGMLLQPGGNLTLNWSGGIGPYQVQMATNLSNPNWQSVDGTVSSTNLVVTPSNNAAFYRIVGQ